MQVEFVGSFASILCRSQSNINVPVEVRTYSRAMDTKQSRVYMIEDLDQKVFVEFKSGWITRGKMVHAFDKLEKDRRLFGAWFACFVRRIRETDDTDFSNNSCPKCKLMAEAQPLFLHQCLPKMRMQAKCKCTYHKPI